MTDEYVVRDNPEELRYEILRDGEVVGGIWYRTAPGVIVLVHTEVAPYGGRAGGRQPPRPRRARRHPLARSPRRAGVPVRGRLSPPSPRAARPRRSRPRASGMTEPSPEQERGPRHDYPNDAIEVHWEPKLCIHVRNCVRGLPHVFDAERRPWIDVDAADADAIAATILTCPTGALHFRRLDGGTQEEGAGDHDRAAYERPPVCPRPSANRRQRGAPDPRGHPARALPLRRLRKQAVL